MKRRHFVTNCALGAGGMIVGQRSEQPFNISNQKEPLNLVADLVIAGGGLGGVAAALSALRNGLRVIVTEETDWVGGQISQQGVPPDEHKWIETHGAPEQYRIYRSAIRDFYRRNYPMTASAKDRKYLNPGDGSVSRLCCEPRVAWMVLMELFAPYLSNKQLTLLPRHKVTAANVKTDTVESLTAMDLREGVERSLIAPYFIDASELGDLLPMTGTAYVTGAESKAQTGELHAAEKADPNNQQSFTMCFAMDYIPEANLVIDKPINYDYWSKHIPEMTPPWSGPLLSLHYSNPKTLAPKELGFHPEGVKTGDKLNLWNYRRILHRNNFLPGTYAGDTTIVNWPQNDYLSGHLIDVEGSVYDEHIKRSKEQSLALFYWLQTEAPRPDGGTGWPGLRLRGDVMGTSDGMAQYPYVRESRRIKALFTVLEEHVGAENRKLVSGESTSAKFEDSVGIGYYHIDLHPSSGGDNYIDFGSLPFQIPMGALIPERMNNLIPANKNIGTTHITNGCYRLHPVEWSIGEAAGLLAVRAIASKTTPRAIREQSPKLKDFQRFITGQGVELDWPVQN